MVEEEQSTDKTSFDSFSREELESFARKLEIWGKGLPSAERELLNYLLFNAASSLTRQKEETHVEKAIKEAAYAALQSYINSKKGKQEILWRRTIAQSG